MTNIPIRFGGCRTFARAPTRCKLAPMNRFITVDRNTPLLLPPDLRDWVHENDLVKFIIEVIDRTDVSTAHVNHRGTGSAQYPPRMMLGLLIYSYACGLFSSRQIERATYDSVSTRYLCADTHPDHDTIATFRRRNVELLQECFTTVLQLAREMKLLKVGTLSLDGTKVHSASSKSQNRSLADLEEEIAELEAKVKNCVEQAEGADQAEERGGLLLPEELGCTQQRMEKLKAAEKALNQRLDALKARREKTKQKARNARSMRSGRKARAETGIKAQAEQVRKQRVNVTEPESRLMPVKKQSPQGFIQGYNAQAAVCSEGVGLMVGCRVTNEASDQGQLEPMLEELAFKPEEVKTVLVDSGYYESLEVERIEQETGVTILSPPTHAPPSGRVKKSRYGPEHPRSRGLAFKQKMLERMQESANKALYQRRKSTVEGAFGMIKATMGFERFRLRTLAGVNIEWLLCGMAYNCRKIAIQGKNQG